MCGLSGIFDLRGERAVDPGRLAGMNDRLAHRGPDGDGTYLAPGIGLGHRRLAVIDIASGSQPVFNETGRVAVVYNGEIYNFVEIAAELKARGHQFRTHCDTEVIVHAWEEWGTDCLRRFNGMFAFALWDADRQALFLARDRLGEKPLYYSVTRDGWLVFASEIGAVVAGLPDVPELDLEAVEDYFAYGFVPDPKTIFRTIRKLPPGHFACVPRGAGDVDAHGYWDIAFPDAPEGAGRADELVDRLREAVRLRLVSDVPLGAFLSGGVDSSSVVALMAGLSPQPVKSCCIGFRDRSFDESAYAAEVARRYRTDHSAVTIDVDAAAMIDDLAIAYGEPFADSSALATFLVCRMARQRVTVALSGDGGDEVFAGYRRYGFHCREEQVKRVLPAWFRRPVFGALGRAYPKLDWAPRPLRAKATLEALAEDAVGGHFRAVTLLTTPQRRRLFSPEMETALGGYSAIEVLRAHALRADSRDPLHRALYLDLKVWLAGGMLVKVDRASMAHGLEVRAPFLDHTLVEWAATLPARVKLAGLEGKAVLKCAMEPLLPHDVLYRPKQGFSIPLDDWLRGPLRGRVEDAIESGEVARCGLFDRSRLRGLLAAHAGGRASHGRILWAILMFDAFLRQPWRTAAPAPARPLASGVGA